MLHALCMTNEFTLWVLMIPVFVGGGYCLVHLFVLFCFVWFGLALGLGVSG